MDTASLLAEYAALLNRYGTDAPEPEAFRQAHAENADFAELAELSRQLKKALAQ